MSHLHKGFQLRLGGWVALNLGECTSHPGTLSVKVSLIGSMVLSVCQALVDLLGGLAQSPDLLVARPRIDKQHFVVEPWRLVFFPSSKVSTCRQSGMFGLKTKCRVRMAHGNA